MIERRTFWKPFLKSDNLCNQIGGLYEEKIFKRNRFDDLLYVGVYDKSDKKYFVYYNKETGWSPNGVDATDWTSPEEFPAHAQRLKDMGNNIILVAYDTNASYKADDTWEASRLRYVMDTAWSMGMKVLVCDEVFYKFSMSDGSDGAASGED